ncbi:chromosomal replication initiator protein DnaA [Aeromicrobium fastidiosum]|uniref:Chromosomal replication initiator protein DnaA n=1 Tax=Aeromicrobium fastidiosum TaxID=52699 RepID=A0A641AU00_9ACTN|nr:chromosomal replication initiator protein DnaA [Aeromicrobium fastidiosum]KAA1380348.1 chromosomal replication initiator protein DnaA [Aeromicrobium fastidiosum]MBP2389912.1 chromosomal replication initiator protein [Aeromicrobium fastidiosum]
MQDGQDGPDEHLAQVWQRAVDTLSPGAKVWVYSAKPLTLHNNIMIVAVQDDLTRAQLESRVRPALEHAISTTLQQETRLVVTIEPSLIETLHSQQDDMSINRQVGAAYDVENDEDDDSGDEFVPSWAERTTAPPRIGTVAEARLNPRYLFENFVIGSSNRFAHAAAVAVAEAPGKAYNPLVIHGESGLGKTHLLHAIGHYVLNLYPSSRVRYVNSEEFTNDVINAIRENRTAALKRKYREIDVLLVDDIQFLEGKESTQTEFFHTFNALHNENKQIVMTSDRPPKNLTTLEDRLRNRFEWGLTTDVQPPDLETRIAILRKKAANEKLTAPADVLEFIASKVQTNIRELEGALIRATAFANLNGTTVDLQLAQIVLKDLIAEGEEPDITVGMIMAQTAAYSEFSIDDLCSTNRSRNLVLARQIAMYLCRELTDMSLPKIGQEFGNRDHTTVMHADRKIRKLMAEKHAVYNQVTELTARIKQQARQS